MLDSIHKYLDRSEETFKYERIATLLLELLLLVATAIPVITGWRSALAFVLVGGLRLFEAEIKREDSSVTGRQKEAGATSPLPPRKVARAEWRRRMLELITWAWPGLIALVQAAESRAIGLALVVSTAATLVRVAWGRVVMPAWRGSRLAWRNAHQSEGQLETAAQEAMRVDGPGTLKIPMRCDGKDVDALVCVCCGSGVEMPHSWKDCAEKFGRLFTEAYEANDQATLKLMSIRDAIGELSDARRIMANMAFARGNIAKEGVALRRVENALEMIAEEVAR